MALVQKMFFMTAAACWIFAAGQVFGEKPRAQDRPDIVLTPADQLILDAIGKVNDCIDKLTLDMNTRFDNMNTRIDGMGQNLNRRIDNLWVTMLSGFLGVMAFIGALVFRDRPTFMKRTRDEMREIRSIL